MPNIKECFETDLPNCLNHLKEVSFKVKDETPIKIGVRLHVDFISNAIFASIFFDNTDLFQVFLKSLGDNIDSILKTATSKGKVTLPHNYAWMPWSEGSAQNMGDFVIYKSKEPGSPIETGTKLTFTKRIFIYSPFEIPENIQLDYNKGISNDYGLEVVFRGPNYAESLSKNPIAFISHDSRDKDNIARPVAAKLRAMGLDVWYDEYSLNPGDSLREEIEKGLKKCKRCILILTPNFLSKGGWAKQEYDSIYTREIIEDKKVFIPIWDDIEAKDVYDYSPILADRIGIKWSIGQDEVCNKIYRVLMES